MNKDLKKLSRLELLEILLEQSKRIEELEEQISNLNIEADSKKIEIDEIGTLAEASLKLTEIFKSADEAAAIYINNVKEKTKAEEKKIKKECLEYKRKKLEEVEKKCKKREEQAEKRLKQLEQKIEEFENKTQKLIEKNKLNKKVSESKAKTSKRKFKK